MLVPRLYLAVTEENLAELVGRSTEDTAGVDEFADPLVVAVVELVEPAWLTTKLVAMLMRERLLQF